MKKLNRKGFTLIELLGVITIIGMVLSMIYGLLLFGVNVFKKTSDDFVIQSDVRLAMEKTNKLVRFSTALFAVPNVEYMDDEWNYIGMNQDHTMIINYTWDTATKTHVEEVMVGPYNGMTFNIGFEKNNNLSTDNDLKLYFESFSENGNSKRYDIKSGYEALNSLQVINYGTLTHPATALAYRGEDFSYENNIIVNIAMVLDTSGSMGSGLVNPNGSISTSNPSRISVLIAQSKVIVEQFASNPNNNVSINIALVPFSSYAKTPSSFYDVKTSSAKNSLMATLDAIKASGNTNTGDALRRAYYALNTKQISDLSTATAGTEIKNYTVILVDGESNNSSMANTSSTLTVWGCVSWFWGRCSKEGYVSSTSWESHYYLNDGTINACSFTPTSTSCTPGYVNSISQANTYVDLMGEYLSNHDFVSNYLVSFATDVSQSQIVYIATSTNIPDARVFYATNASQLGLSFTEIQMAITNDLWQILGPKLTLGVQ